MKDRSSSSQVIGPASGLSYDFLLSLKERETRDREGVFFTEGFRFAFEAVKAASPIVAVAWCPELARPYSTNSIADQLARYPQFRLTRSQMVELGFSPEPQGIALIIKQQRLALSKVHLRNPGAWLGIESIRTLGNLGTILRSMVAAGSPGLFLFGNRGTYQDVYDPQVVRASMGAQLALPVVQTTYRDFNQWTYRGEIRVLGADAAGGLDYRKVAYRRPLLFMLGGERSGLSPGQRSVCDSMVKIPMARHIDSLNVAMAATVLLFEAFGHQRR
jgi:TrmH family RNA methyltransferase